MTDAQISSLCRTKIALECAEKELYKAMTYHYGSPEAAELSVEADIRAAIASVNKALHTIDAARDAD